MYLRHLSSRSERTIAANVAGIADTGSSRNAATNQQVINDELRNQCISIIRRDAYKSAGAIDLGEQGIPDINFDKAAEQGATARFFEQAFGWEQMVYCHEINSKQAIPNVSRSSVIRPLWLLLGPKIRVAGLTQEQRH